MSLEFIDIFAAGSEHADHAFDASTTLSPEYLATLELADTQLVVSVLQENADSLDAALNALPDSPEVEALKDEMFGIQINLSNCQEDLMQASEAERPAVMEAVQKEIVELNQKLAELDKKVTELSTKG